MATAEDLLEAFSSYFSSKILKANDFKSTASFAFISRTAGLLETVPVTVTRLNQLLHLHHEAGVSDGFFRYYFLEHPAAHFYPVRGVESYFGDINHNGISSTAQLRYGLERFTVDALFCFGDIRSSYRELRNKSYEQLVIYFSSKRIDTDQMRARGKILRFNEILVDERHLIGEIANATYGGGSIAESLLETLAVEQYRRSGLTKISITDLLNSMKTGPDNRTKQLDFEYLTADVQNVEISSDDQIRDAVRPQINRFRNARKSARGNTNLYLSLIRELDVYAATSMRTREDFRNTARDVKKVFEKKILRDLNVRYFDPTMSVADCAEDKGLIECLMVKCCRCLLYFAAEKDSFGKDAEAAMALSLGKPVIIYCPANDAGNRRAEVFKNLHPLTRLINFSNGVACGAIVTQDLDQAAELLRRLLENEMEYVLQHDGAGAYRLREKLTNCVVRLQTSDTMLRETFWNYYHHVS